MEQTTIVIPLKKHSKRLPDKNFRPFGDTTLWQLKIDTLLPLELPILVDSDDEGVLEMVARAYPGRVDVQLRPSFYGSPECDNSMLFEYLGQSAPDGVVIYAPVTAPFVRAKSIARALKVYHQSAEIEAVVSCFDLQEHVWYKGTPVSYDPENAPNSQDLQGLYVLTYGFGILHKKTLVRWRNVIGTGGKIFYTLNEIEAVDIDTPHDFTFAQYIYEKGLHHRQRSQPARV